MQYILAEICSIKELRNGLESKESLKTIKSFLKIFFVSSFHI